MSGTEPPYCSNVPLSTAQVSLRQLSFQADMLDAAADQLGAEIQQTMNDIVSLEALQAANQGREPSNFINPATGEPLSPADVAAYEPCDYGERGITVEEEPDQEHAEKEHAAAGDQEPCELCVAAGDSPCNITTMCSQYWVTSTLVCSLNRPWSNVTAISVNSNNLPLSESSEISARRWWQWPHLSPFACPGGYG
eukprot:COSAG01_NODE_17956_length_1111_cov_5.546443_1_plen_194_part_10